VRHAASLDSGNVSESLDNTVVVVEDNKGTTALNIAAVASLALASAEVVGCLDLLNVSICTKGGEDLNGLLCLLGVLELVGNNEGNLRDVVDAVSASKDKGGDGRGSEGRGNSVAALVDIDLAVPLAPSLGGVEHTTTSAHVGEGSLARAVSSTTVHTRHTSDGATGSPRLSSGLHTSTLLDGIGLAVVLVQVGVNKLNNIRADGGDEDSREGDGGARCRILSKCLNSDKWS